MLESWAYLRVTENRDAVAARRLAWWYFVREARSRAQELLERIAYRQSVADSYQADIDRGVATTGKPYSAYTLNEKQRQRDLALAEHDNKRKELAALAIPSYRDWCAMVSA